MQLAYWLQRAELQPGERVLALSCGVVSKQDSKQCSSGVAHPDRPFVFLYSVKDRIPGFEIPHGNRTPSRPKLTKGYATEIYPMRNVWIPTCGTIKGDWFNIRVSSGGQDLGSMWKMRQQYHSLFLKYDFQDLISHMGTTAHRWQQRAGYQPGDGIF